MHSTKVLQTTMTNSKLHMRKALLIITWWHSETLSLAFIIQHKKSSIPLMLKLYTTQLVPMHSLCGYYMPISLNRFWPSFHLVVFIYSSAKVGSNFFIYYVIIYL